MHAKSTVLTLTLLLAGSHWAAAQTKDAVKAQLATSVCDCLSKKSTITKPEDLSKSQIKQVFIECFGGAAGKNIKAIQQAYGKEAFNDKVTMRTMGEEVGFVLVQDCPGSMAYFVAIGADKSDVTQPTAATTGQTVGQLGALSGTGIAQLTVQVSKTEKASFAWLRHFEQADELLGKLPKLQGQQARVSWQEVEVLEPSTRQYQKVREITAIELL